MVIIQFLVKKLKLHAAKAGGVVELQNSNVK